MLMPLAVTQRVIVDPGTGERRDALDQRWFGFLQRCGFLAIPIPNRVEVALTLLDATRPRGLLLTGGNSLAVCGGNAPERDFTEAALLDRVVDLRLPVLGVCRGMQLIQHRLGVPLERVEGHVCRVQTILAEERRISVNSYHEFGARTSVADLEVWARADDGVVEAVRHRKLPWVGIMWHPERTEPAAQADVDLLRHAFELHE